MKPLPETFTQTRYLYAQPADYYESGWHFYSTESDGALEGFVCVGKQEVTFSINQEIDINQELIAQLETKKEEVKLEQEEKLAKIDDAIRKLLALPAPEVDLADLDDDDIPF